MRVTTKEGYGAYDVRVDDKLIAHVIEHNGRWNYQLAGEAIFVWAWNTGNPEGYSTRQEAVDDAVGDYQHALEVNTP